MQKIDARPDLSPEILSDEEIVARVLGGDTALFELIMRRYNQRVYRTIRAVIRDESEVEDAMQQAYVNAYRHLAQFAGQAQFSTWLLKIALHEAFARARRKTFLVAESQSGEAWQDSLANTPSKAATPEENASNAELKSILEQQILALPDRWAQH